MLYYVEINYYGYIGEKSLRFHTCGEWEEPPEGYNVNEVNHRPLARELFGYFEASSEEIAKLRALIAFISWLKNHMTTIETTISYLDENVKEIEEEIKKRSCYKVDYSKISNGHWCWETELADVFNPAIATPSVNPENGCVFVTASNPSEAIKLAKKKVYEEVYKRKNAFDPLLASCEEAFRS